MKKQEDTLEFFKQIFLKQLHCSMILVTEKKPNKKKNTREKLLESEKALVAYETRQERV